MRPGNHYTRHQLSDYQVAALETLDKGGKIYVGKTYRSLQRKELIRPIGFVDDGKYGRALLTPEGVAALQDSRNAGWRREFVR